ncbi:hypothetical protein SDC9_161605 [bioreactor metagenome]|uniref:Uncharacterized protein n=1 Tax=bioreactor metagenome TaxID=1076179 RepID=A0A645FLQ9_9ZZZZ
MVEELIDVKPITAFGSCRHTKQEVACEVVQYLAIGVCTAMVHLIDHDVVKIV